MASIFTYDPDPPRVSSPWLAPEDVNGNSSKASPSLGQMQTQTGLLSEYGVTKLQAEPQFGPTEYKLHLLLRPRRIYQYMSTSSQSKAGSLSSSSKLSTSATTSATQPRQQRLKQLTTQLLWRLQQSSPYHATSSKELKLPKLPSDGADLSAPVQCEALVPGLEESRGALYEIGVSDDGTLIGLTKDEMDESLTTLRVMAASLGCSVEVVRMVLVGDCEWTESTELVDDALTTPAHATKQGRLWVAEALVAPNLGLGDTSRRPISPSGQVGNDMEDKEASDPVEIPSRGSSTTPQIRVTLTGPTTSGKSSLLGTLSTGTLDNGRGKSRLSLLKHRHEMVSGITSSIAQELIGYKDQAILNFSQGNIESWIDIHDCAEGGRLVFVTDSGGHPRYRRTVLRGLLNWAPHWSILCVAADDAEEAAGAYGATSSAKEVLGSAAAGVDLVKAHVTLSLKLEVPIAIVITKLDLASKTSLQKTVGKILTAIKEAGRIPKILQPDQKHYDDLKNIPPQDHAKVRLLVQGIVDSGSLIKHVPIVLTSAVKGIGIGLLHALLESLPLPPTPTAGDYVGMALNPEQPRALFHIDNTFSLPASYGSLVGNSGRYGEQGVVVSGHARFGSLSVGDQIVFGPFPAEEEDPRGLAPDDRPSPGSYGLSISHPASAELARIAMKNVISASTIVGEWHAAQIVSIRNLRLPVRTLAPGQAGSIGLVFERDPNNSSCADTPRIRRGMVLAIPSKHMLETNLSLQAASGFTATFKDPSVTSLAIGSFVNVYVASVRAAARVIGVSSLHHRHAHGPSKSMADEEEIFNLNDDVPDAATDMTDDRATGGEVCLELLHNREWFELGSQVILLEGGSQDRSGLEGFVGNITEIVD
ncbi:hypothetical protein S40285_07831 [Stachybotrys chlorohalonatus IBT 40285]|uniref:Tr-type G domain-containing protein n=1 Tax=Stachybotrys chlorohalonatus (strain IBT 40285) TaxID=1283841 RepID=A0A084QCI0_STAC4|nr:hypothetical protein S40285_07831 [Stachybotrys chlorohalonata IBT 40285]